MLSLPAKRHFVEAKCIALAKTTHNEAYPNHIPVNIRGEQKGRPKARVLIYPFVCLHCGRNWNSGRPEGPKNGECECGSKRIVRRPDL